MSELFIHLPLEHVPMKDLAGFAWDAAWQGAVLAPIVWLAMRCSAGRPAVTAWLTSLALGMCLLLPLASLGGRLSGWGLIEKPMDGGNASAVEETFDPPFRQQQAEDFVAVANESKPSAAEASPLPPSSEHALPKQETSPARAGFSSTVRPTTSAAWTTSRETIVAYGWLAWRIGWLGAAVWLAGRLLLSFAELRRLCCESPLCRNRVVLAACRRAARTLGLPHAPVVLVSSRVECPAVFAWRGGRLFIPSTAKPKSADHWYRVFCHELAHLRRGDGGAGLLSELIKIVLPWHPAVWWLASEHRRACEEACDDWVVFSGADSVDYAMDLADWIPTKSWTPAMGIGSPAHGAKRRIERLLYGEQSPKPRVGAGWLWGGALGGGAVLLLFTLLQPRIASVGEPESPIADNPGTPVKVSSSTTTESLPSESAASPSESAGTKIPDRTPNSFVGPRSVPRPAPEGLAAVLGDGRLKHWNRVEVIGFDATDTTLVTNSRDGTVKFWSVATGKEQQSIDGVYNAAGLSADRKTLLLGNRFGRLKMLDAATGKRQRTLEGLGALRGRIAASSNGKRLAIVNSFHSIVILDDDGKTVQTIDGGRTNSLGRRAAWSAPALSPDGAILAVCEGNGSGAVALWDVASGERLHTIAAHLKERASSHYSVFGLCFSPDGATLATAGGDGAVKLWDVSDGAEKTLLDRGMGSVQSVQFTADGRHLTTVGLRFVALWNTATGEQVWTTDRTFMLNHRLNHTSAVNQTETRIAVAAGHRVLLLDLANGQEVSPGGKRIDELVEIAVAPKELSMAARSSNGQMSVWDLTTGQRLRSWPGRSSYLRGIALSGAEGIVAAFANPQTIMLWNAETGALLRKLHAPDMFFRSMAFDEQGTTLAANSSSGAIVLWDTRRGTVERQWTVDRSRPAGALAFGGESTLFSVEDARRLFLWDTQRGQVIKSLGPPTRNTLAPLAVSHDGQQAAVGTAGGQFALWDIVEEKRVATVLERTKNARPRRSVRLTALAFSPDGETVASSGDDGKIRLYNAQDGTLLRSLRIGPPGGLIRTLAFTAAGGHLLTGNGNGTAYLLRLQ